MEGIKRIWIVFIPILIIGGIFVLIRSGQGSKVDVSNVKGIETFTPTPTATNNTDMNNSSPSAVTSLKVEDELVGTGDIAVVGKTVTVNYVGTLISGVKFDSSYDRNQPFSFHLGAGEVIKGWDQGVAGMKVGGKRKLTIPSELGYGAAGALPTIPGNATLIFEVELLKVE